MGQHPVIARRHIRREKKERGRTGMRQSNRKLNGWNTLGELVRFILARLKAMLVFLQLGKKSGAVLSMAVAMAIYAWFYQWEFALGVTLMILVHELGHVEAARRKNIPVTAPFFIPFLGALIMLKRNPRDAETEAYVAMGGPLLGTLGAVVSFLLGAVTGHKLLFAIAYIGFMLNLINLLPIHPLDGGRIASTVTRWLWVAGIVGGAVAAFYMQSILFFIVWALFAWDLFSKYVMNRGKSSVYTHWGKLEIPFSEIQGDDWLITPFREQVQLPYRTYSSLDGTQWIDIDWEEGGVVKLAKMPEQALIRSVLCTKIERKWQRVPKTVVLRFQVEYEAHENERYYEVPFKTRWKFGICYGSLALFLIFMMHLIESMLATSGGFFHSLRK